MLAKQCPMGCPKPFTSHQIEYCASPWSVGPGPVIDVLCAKHPSLRKPSGIGAATSECYAELPDPPPVDVTGASIEKVATRLSGAAGPSGVDAVDLQNWLLRYGKESSALWEELAEWASWLANQHPPWAAYRARMACRLVARDKEPGVRPVGIGEIFRRLFAKAILLLVGREATSACDNLNLCVGLKAGIEGAVHALRDAWEEDLNGPPPAPDKVPELEEDPPGEGAAYPPLPDLRHTGQSPGHGDIWPCPHPLSLDLRKRHPRVLQPWHADDAVMEGRASDVAAAMASLIQAGPARGYFPSPEKSVVLVRPADQLAAHSHLEDFQFRYQAGARYLGSFLGAESERDAWLAAKIDTWISAVQTLVKIAKRYPQMAYAGMARSFQME
jgi:hypothetical protein